MNINCFIPYGQGEGIENTVKELIACPFVNKIFILSEENIPSLPKGSTWLQSRNLHSSETLKNIAAQVDSPYLLLYLKNSPLSLSQFALERFTQVCEDIGAGFVYSDYYGMKNGETTINPVIDYQEGSLRDDFNFGSLLFFKSEAFCDAVNRTKDSYAYAGLYNLRLKLSQQWPIFRIPEYLYTEIELDNRLSGEKIFDYVDPKNRQVQIEMEKACTEHLKEIGGYMEPRFDKISFDERHFSTEASVIIPVRNRVKTIEDAIKSVLSQKTDFKFNLIVVDNYSTDGTTEILERYATSDKRLIHIIPQRKDLGIGGCWNEALSHPQCGKFAIQLDSDDLYIDDNTIKQIVEAFYEQQCGMVVGSYQMVNFKLEEIPPGIIDHKEWTPDNGRNNALRINGLGAPRAFYTPLLRKIKIPNVSYGEDYAVGLSISRHYQIGRVYSPLYLCRRWDDNSDASLDVVKMNGHNLYKDRIRTIELKARIHLNQLKNQIS
ncbi:MAG: glycosyltransferase family 2 protein [Bacteroidota bacterium]|nr:glycosyltransferase family 2 protein [Bacteroidota bacterium]